MEKARWQRMQDLFHLVRERPAEERATTLHQNCDDQALRDEVQALLDATAAEETMFLEPPMRLSASQSEAIAGRSALGSLSGRQLGDCRLRRLVGEGGMGAVYEAVQSPWNRRVAVKVIRGLPSAEVRQRFEFEARVLAALRHPCIAQIHATGVHVEAATGVEIPYFVMEFVPDALPLTTYVRARQLGVHARLELLERVCQGVHHGHLNAVIHRDLKPGNILIDADGCPKIIDFGLARSTSGVIARAFQTQDGMVVGTPAYMSPEQLEGEDVDARTDVHALGVLLYELICGERPYDVGALKWAEARRIVCEEPVPRPSRIAEIARGDLDTIIMKALAKERDQRYPSVDALGDDLRRFRTGLPVAARPLTLGYQLRLFARRHRSAVVAATVVLIAIVAASVISITMAIRAERRADEAEALVDLSRDLSEWVADELQLRIAELPGSTTLRRELVGRVITWLDGVRLTAGDSPALLRTVARSYRIVARIEGESNTGLASPPRALATLAKSLSILERLRREGPDDPALDIELARTHLDRAHFLMSTADWRAAGAILDGVEATVAPHLGDEALGRAARNIKATALFQRSSAMRRDGRTESAIAAIVRAQSLLPVPNPDEGPEGWRTYNRWDFQRMMATWDTGDVPAARLIWQSLRTRMQSIADFHGMAIKGRTMQAFIHRIDADFLYYDDRKAETARSHFQKAIDLLAPLHALDPEQAGHAHELALLHSRMVAVNGHLNDHAEARRHVEAGLRIQRSIVAAAPESTLELKNLRLNITQLADIAADQKDWSAAEKAGDEALALARNIAASDPGPDSDYTVALAFAGRGRVERKRERHTAARDAFAEAVTILERLQEEHPGTWGVDRMLENMRFRVEEMTRRLANERER